MNLKSEKGVTGIDMTAGIIIFIIGSAVIFNMYVNLYSLMSRLKVNEAIIGYVTEVCEEIDYENYDDITEARLEEIIRAANIPEQYKVSTSISKYSDEVKNSIGTTIEDLVKRISINVRYTVDGQSRNYTINKIKVRER